MLTVDNRFKVLEEDGKYRKCGEGGMGVVYFVEDLDRVFNFEIVIMNKITVNTEINDYVIIE